MTRPQRFYEQDPIVKQAVEMMLIFPADIQTIVASSLTFIAEQDLEAEKLMKNFKSMGGDKILALHKSKKKDRAYDNNPVTHQAMNYLMIMEPTHRRFIAVKVMELNTYIREYVSLCKAANLPLKIETIRTIADTYTRQSPEQVQQFLQLVRTELAANIQRSTEKISLHKSNEASGLNDNTPVNIDDAAREKDAKEAIKSENTGMRIRGKLE